MAIKRASSAWLAAITVLAACLGGLGASIAFGEEQTTPVLLLARTVLQGEVIESADLAVAEVVVNGAPYVPASSRQAVVGTRALTTLPNGYMLVPGSFGDPILPDGTTQLSLRLSPSQVPSCPLAGGQWLLLVGLPGMDQEEDERLLIYARVVYPPVLQVDGTVILDVAVPRFDVSRLVPYLLERRVSVVVVR